MKKKTGEKVEASDENETFMKTNPFDITAEHVTETHISH